MLAARVVQSPPNLLFHFFHALRGVHIVKQAQPSVVRHQRLGLLVIRLQPRRYNFFPVVRPLQQFPAIVVAAPFCLWRALVKIINLAARLAHAPASDAPENQSRIDDQMNHERPPKSMLLQQLAQVLRLSDGPRKSVEHKTVRTIRLLDARSHDLEHQRIRHKLAALHNRLGSFSKRCALGYVFPEHIAGRKVRHRILPRKLFRLRAFPRARRPE